MGDLAVLTQPLNLKKGIAEKARSGEVIIPTL